jgi:surface antigen
MRLHGEFGISVSHATIYRALNELGFSHLSARPRKAYKQAPEAVEAFQKISRTRGGSPREARARHTGRVWFQDEMRVGQKNKRTSSPTVGLGRARAPAPTISAPSRPTRSVQFARTAEVGAAFVLPACNSETMQLHLDEIAAKVAPGARVINFDQAGWHGTKKLRIRHAHPNSTAKRTYGSSRVKTGFQTGSSNLLTTSSTTVVLPETRSSASRGRSCRSPDATGRPSVTHSED